MGFKKGDIITGIGKVYTVTSCDAIMSVDYVGEGGTKIYVTVVSHKHAEYMGNSYPVLARYFRRFSNEVL